VLRDQLNRFLRKRCGEWNGDGANSHGREQCEYPLWDVFHQNADPVTAFDAFCAERGRYLSGAVKHVGIPVLLHFVLVIEDEGNFVGRALCPRFDLIEDPARGRGVGNTGTCNFRKEGHTTFNTAISRYTASRSVATNATVRFKWSMDHGP